MNVVKSYRFKEMLENIITSSDPEEVHDIFTEFLGGEFETEGHVRYKSVDLSYFISYEEDKRQIIFEVTVTDRLDVTSQEPVWHLKMRFKRDNLSYLYKDLKGLFSLMQ